MTPPTERLFPIFGIRFRGFGGPAGPLFERNGVVLSDGETCEERRVWICSKCGARSVWGDGWRTYGTIECIEKVYCEKCADAAKEKP